MERLQKVIARAGIASRRRAEELIASGRVRVNGQVVTELGVRVDPATDRVEVDGRPVVFPRLVYLMLHKPRGVVTTLRDPQGRATVLDLVPGVPERLFPVGRLDYDSEGLLVLTNDGELAHRLMHPSFEVVKVYRVCVAGKVTGAALKRLREGVMLDDGMTAPARVQVLSRREDGTWLEIGIHEGRNRQVRRMAKAVGLSVRRLIRIAYGPLRLGNLPPGKFRFLKESAVAALKQSVQLDAGTG